MAYPHDGRFALLISQRSAALLMVFGLISLTPVLRGEEDSTSLNYLPQVGNGEFDGGRLRTTFILTNTSPTASVAKLTLASDAGDALPLGLWEGQAFRGESDRFTFVLSPGGTRFLATDGQGEVKVGTALFQSDGELTVAAVFSILDRDGNLVTEAGVGASAPSTQLVLPVDSSDRFRSGLALVNTDPATQADLNLRLYDASGQATGTDVQLILEASGHRARFADELFSNLGTFQGTLTIQADRPIAAITIRQNLDPVAFTTLPVFSADSVATVFNLPQIADGVFTGGSIRTALLLFSLGQPAQVDVVPTRDDGGKLELDLKNAGKADEFHFDLGAHESLFLESRGVGELVTGAARVQSDSPIGVAAVFSIFDSKGAFLTESGIGESSSLLDLALPVKETATFATGIAIFNPHGSPTTVSLALLDENGNTTVGETLANEATRVAESSAATLTLEPYGHRAKFVGELFSGVGEFQGSVGISASAEVSALTIRQNSVPLSFTTLPVAKGTLEPQRGAGLLLNEVRYLTSEGQSQFVELLAIQDVPFLAGIRLKNTTGSAFSLPSDIGPLNQGDLLLILFDGENRVEDETVHAPSTTFFETISDAAVLENAAGMQLDRVGWGEEGLPIGRAASIIAPLEPGQSLGRKPNHLTRGRSADWIAYSDLEASPLQPNTPPPVDMMFPLQSAFLPEGEILLQWYPLFDADGYRLQLARNESFTDMVLETSTGLPHVWTSPLQPGVYFFRVQVDYQEGVQSAYSYTSSFLVEAASPADSISPASSPLAVLQRRALPLTHFVQHKDTPMLQLENPFVRFPTPGGDRFPLHAWDAPHNPVAIQDGRPFFFPGGRQPDGSPNAPYFPACTQYCAAACLSMINAWFHGSSAAVLSQDRIAYEAREVRAKRSKSGVGGPEFDLPWSAGLSLEEVTEAWDFALGSRPRVRSASDKNRFWDDLQAEVLADRPVLLGIRTVAGTYHMVVAIGYRVITDDTGSEIRQILAHNPWYIPPAPTIPVVYSLDESRFKGGRVRPVNVVEYLMAQPGNINPASDEDSLWTDSERDGIYDFDEEKRFKTKIDSFDSDEDFIPDKTEISASRFYPLFGYARNERTCPSNEPLEGNRCDADSDGKDMELDPDSDGGGCPDGFEDFNFNGTWDDGELHNFLKVDDQCHVQGWEDRSYGIFQTSFKFRRDVLETTKARFCAGPVLPGEEDPNVHGRARIQFRQFVEDKFEKENSFCFEKAFTVVNDTDVDFDADVAGGVGPGIGGVGVSVFPNPNAIEATAKQSITPSCENYNVAPFAWRTGIPMWNGVGNFQQPWRRISAPYPLGLMPTTVPIVPAASNVTKNTSTLQVWFVTRTEDEARFPCRLP